MWMHYPSTGELFSVDDQYLVGSDLLVKPVTAPNVVESTVKFPTDDCWYDAESLVQVAATGAPNKIQEITVPSDIDTIPVFQRGGSIIARKLRLRRSTHMMTNDPYTLYVAMDASRKAAGQLYIDDEVSFDHAKKAEYVLADLSADFSDKKMSVITNTVEVGAGWEGTIDSMASGYLVERVIVMGLQTAPSSIDVGGVPAGFTYNIDSKILVIRKPGVSAVKMWQIKVSF